MRKTTSALRAMIWKECRENIPWALMGMLGLTLGLLISVTVKVDTVYYRVKDFTEFWMGVSAAMTMECALIAAGLGFMQILPERRRDQWAFLTHRPASRTALFWGKAAPGLLLYSVATLTPLLAVGAWAAVPGHMAAPFDPRLLLPGIAAICAGAAAYFGAILTALREVRWYGSRALPLLIAFVWALFAVDCSNEFVTVLGYAVAIAAVFGYAAWAAFVQGAGGGRQNLFGSLSLAAVLYAAFFGLFLGAAFMINSLEFPARVARSERSEFDQYGLAASTGQIVRVRFGRSREANNSFSSRATGVYDLAGRRLSIAGVPGGDDSPVHFARLLTSTFPSFGYTDSRRYLRPINGYSEQQGPGLLWSYVASERLIAVYRSRGRQFLGWFGVDGFAPIGSAKPAPFPGSLRTVLEQNNLNPSHLYAFTHTVYRFDAFDARGKMRRIGERRMVPIFQTAADNPIAALDVSYPVDDSRDKDLGVNKYSSMVFAQKGVELIDWRGALLLSLPWAPGEGAQQTMVEESFWSGGGKRPDRVLFLFTPWKGGVTRALLTTTQGKQIQEVRLEGHPRPSVSAWSPCYGLLAPAAALPALLGLLGDPSIHDAFITYSLAASLLWAALAWPLATFFSAGRRARLAWPIVGFCFGVPALLTLLALSPPLARLPCPVCGRKRLATRDCCEHCGAAFPPPPRDGTEIFEPPQTAAHAA